VSHLSAQQLAELRTEIARLAHALGFEKLGVAAPALPEDEARLNAWLAAGRHGAMRFMEAHGTLRSRPAELIPGTVRVIATRMRAWPPAARDPLQVLEDGRRAYIARYALGRDYHKVLRPRLQKLADRIEERIGEFGYRVFVDSGPVLERALARAAGLGWVGKHTNLLDRDGSWFMLGEIFTDLPLPLDTPVTEHCGSCRACLDVCPTGAIVAPYEVDARRCISYLTIELRGSIPEELRPAIGNRIFGCDDCQLFCPWNKFAAPTSEPDFGVRHGLDDAELVALFEWSEEEWRVRTEGSALRRAGYESWLRNLAVSLGNAPALPEVVAALAARADHESAVVREHVRWALARQASRRGPPGLANCVTVPSSVTS
jgi:epoxyqueuosine reductase